MTSSTKYPGVRKDDKGQFFFQVELGVDQITGKRITKKARKSATGKPFQSAQEAYKELTRVKNDYNKSSGYSNYRITYLQFMKNNFLEAYKAKVQISTLESKIPALRQITERFVNKKLRDITVQDCENFRLFLINKSGYKQSYASQVYGLFRQSLDYAVSLNYLDFNISKKTQAIPKGKCFVEYWTKEEFEKVIQTFYLNDLYDHMSFLSIWLYYTTGIRVSEGLALQWSDVDFQNKKLRINKTLVRSRGKWELKQWTKTDCGMRTISLDNDTISYLRNWKAVHDILGLNEFIMTYSGNPLSRSTIMRIITQHAKIANVKRIQGKGLRHSHVSYMINEFNASVLLLSKRLGHSSPEITLKHYSHLWSRSDEGLAEMITGNIKVITSDTMLTKNNGNQSYNPHEQVLDISPAKLPA